jgi:integrase
MSSDAWIYQKAKQIRDRGPERASWSVGWYEPDGHRKGKSCGPGLGGRSKAEKLKRKIESELMTGTYKMQSRKLWNDFVKEYARRILDGLSPRSRDEALAALACFQRVVKPIRVFAINTGHVGDFVAARRQEDSFLHKGEKISPATVNKDLRHVKAALRVAFEWGYLHQVPRFRMEKVPKKLPSHVTPEDFVLLYKGCDHARRPANLPYSAADWWRGLLITGYMTGWRIGQLLELRREDVDLAGGTALTRAEHNKGKRDQIIPLHPLVIEHLKPLVSFDPCLFPWNHNRRQLFKEFVAIQEKAGVRPRGGRGHYGFHDLRRAFATMNADKLTPDALQALMQHKSYQTTQVYINMARQLTPAVQTLFVPDLGPTVTKAGAVS